jgi:hypothetical protein
VVDANTIYSILTHLDELNLRANLNAQSLHLPHWTFDPGCGNFSGKQLSACADFGSLEAHTRDKVGK